MCIEVLYRKNHVPLPRKATTIIARPWWFFVAKL